VGKLLEGLYLAQCEKIHEEIPNIKNVERAFFIAQSLINIRINIRKFIVMRNYECKECTDFFSWFRN
jgi:hypothetical protein